jgi:hypothetical protein
VVGLLALNTRPMLAGVLLGLAGAIKPQALVLLPLALVAIGQWRALASAALAVGVAVVASLAAFGPQAWIEWLGAIPKFEHFVMTTPGLQKGVITPTGLGISMGLDREATGLWRFGFFAGALAMVWNVFRKSEDPARRLTALLGGGLFVSPYAMHYDAALLAPAAALMLTHRSAPGAWISALAMGALLCCAAIPHWGAAAVTAFVILVALTREGAMPRALLTPALALPRQSESPA